jgi:serine protease AprX
MRIAPVFMIVVAIAVVSTLSAHAGQLDSDLAATVSQATPDSLISVWIELKQTTETVSLKTAVASAATRAEAHAVAVTELKRRAVEQTALVDHLTTMKSLGQADRVKGHWIVNIVEADVTANQLAELAQRTDIANVYLKPTVTSLDVSMNPSEGDLISPDSAANNLRHINADDAWTAGFTGAGRIVCSFDTGINGLHPALLSSWKGNDGNSEAAWFAPLDGSTFPHWFPASPGLSTTPYHGTHVMGIMVGTDPTTHDTIGVAPGAKWISAAVIDIPGASVLDAFEWAADPDGNPNTISDVPDVINHSWGFRNISCLNIFYTAIDNTEALGIVNIFAVGNSGPTVSTVQTPADRALDSLDCFAVGNLNHLTDVIATTSSRGPSPCDNVSIKPNVVAPGTSIRSAAYNYPTVRYSLLSGSSMAAPHVSGLVALIRQKNPNATVDQIKTAILTSTRTSGTWGEMPNNNYGWGEIDCMAALNKILPTNATPNLRLYDFVHVPIAAGDTVVGRVQLQNLGASASGVTAVVLGTNNALTILDGTLNFGEIGAGGVVISSDSIRVVVADSVTDGTVLATDLVVTRGVVHDSLRLYFLIGEQPSKSVVTHTGSRIQFSLSNFGPYGMGDGSIFPLAGVGFKFDGGTNDLYEGGLMIGTGYAKVSSGVHTYTTDPDMDFKVAPSGDLVLSVPGSSAPQQTISMFNDSKAMHPIGVLVTQESFMYDDPNDDFVVLKYILKNTSGAEISDLYLGLYMDWDLPSSGYSSNAGGYETNGAFVWQAYYTGSVYSRFRGLKLLEGQVSARGAIGSEVYNQWAATLTTPGDGFTPDEKFGAMTSGSLYADANKTARKDLFSIIGAGPITLSPNQRDTVTIAILAANSLDSLRSAALHAESVITDVDDPDVNVVLPDKFELYQNYPNPFNPTTVITFDLPIRSKYKLEVINVLGQTLYQVEAEARSGRVEIPWNGDGYASGAYFYRVTVGESSITRKMMLLK